jgi:hypothetical protein
MTRATPPTLRQSALRVGPWLAVGLLGLSACYLLWMRAPRHRAPVAFVRVGAGHEAVNLPIQSFACASMPQSTRRCERTFEGRRLVLIYTPADWGAAVCRAAYANRSRQCMPGSVHRGYPEPALHVLDDLGLTTVRRRTMRLLDPLSHVAEGDWAVPMWMVAAMTGASWLAATYVWLVGVRRWLRRVLALAAGVVGLFFGLAACSVALLWLGYLD